MKKAHQHIEETNPTPETKQAHPNEAPDPNLIKITELTNDLQRTRADFENFRKNVEKDRDSARKLAKFATVEKFLPLLDDLERAIATYPELSPLAKSFEKSITNLGLTKIETAPGTEFNPEFHEAVMSEGEGDKETIAETLRPGYLYEGEVLRPAMVKIQLA
ncbi:nucleotide exchange factor GrpE [Candidatus Saccharibacteria bacterium]|nr:nucleotide exchange factor GrpE [Candidatus Saccharibacteria bacterium]